MIEIYKCPGGRLPCSNPCYQVVPSGTKVNKLRCLLESPQEGQTARFFKLESYQITELTTKCARAIAYGSPVQDIKKAGLN